MEGETVTGTPRLDRARRKGGAALIKERKQLDKNHQLSDVLKKDSRCRSCRLRYLQTPVREDETSSGEDTLHPKEVAASSYLLLAPA